MLAVSAVSGINPAQIGLVLTYTSEYMRLFSAEYPLNSFL